MQYRVIEIIYYSLFIGFVTNNKHYQLECDPHNTDLQWNDKRCNPTPFNFKLKPDDDMLIAILTAKCNTTNKILHLI